MRFKVLAVVAMLACGFVLSGQDSTPYGERDGNWWNQLSPSIKIGYVMGVVDGASAGPRFLQGALVGAGLNECAAQLDAQADPTFKAIYGTRRVGQQMLDGLDQLYSDFRNRAIIVPLAMSVVWKQINGASASEVEKMLIGQRKPIK